MEVGGGRGGVEVWCEGVGGGGVGDEIKGVVNYFWSPLHRELNN